MIPKNVLIKLASVTYSGKAIGNDIRIEIKAREQILNTDITLERGGTANRTIDDPSEPWKKGRYDIEIPDAPHEGGLRYLHKAPKALVWFRIGHDDEKYIHTGRGTRGCITVIEHERWNEIYDILIRARKGDERSVGILEVID